MNAHRFAQYINRETSAEDRSAIRNRIGIYVILSVIFGVFMIGLLMFYAAVLVGELVILAFAVALAGLSITCAVIAGVTETVRAIDRNGSAGEAYRDMLLKTMIAISDGAQPVARARISRNNRGNNEVTMALGHFLRIGTTSIVPGAPASSRPVGAAHGISAWRLRLERGDFVPLPPGRQDAGAPSAIEVVPTSYASPRMDAARFTKTPPQQNLWVDFGSGIPKCRE